MEIRMEIRAILYSRKTTLKTLNKSFEGTGIELVGVTEVPEMISILKQETFDLVLVDDLAKGTEAVCHYIHEFEAIPLVLIVHGRNTDWKRLQRLGADSFIPAEARKDELAARLRVVWRRFLLPDRLRRLTLCPDALKYGSKVNVGEMLKPSTVAQTYICSGTNLMGERQQS
ncbi:hypothetical protein ACFLXX_04355 [Chloroflexota bacterium]